MDLLARRMTVRGLGHQCGRLRCNRPPSSHFGCDVLSLFLQRRTLGSLTLAHTASAPKSASSPVPQQIRHKPPIRLAQPRPLTLACAPLKSHANVSAIARAAGCSGIERLIVCGNAKVREHIARESVTALHIEVHRTLEPYLARQKQQSVDGTPPVLIALEQTSRSVTLHSFRFPRRAILVVGNEARGLSDETLSLCDAFVEIPMYGPPFSHNVATAAAIALYEYCRQYPNG